MLPIRAFKGQGLVEYALILVFVAIVVIVVLAIFGTQSRRNLQQHRPTSLVIPNIHLF